MYPVGEEIGRGCSLAHDGINVSPETHDAAPYSLLWEKRLGVIRACDDCVAGTVHGLLERLELSVLHEGGYIFQEKDEGTYVQGHVDDGRLQISLIFEFEVLFFARTDGVGLTWDASANDIDGVEMEGPPGWVGHVKLIDIFMMEDVGEVKIIE
jgi:hypothetical protein